MLGTFLFDFDRLGLRASLALGMCLSCGTSLPGDGGSGPIEDREPILPMLIPSPVLISGSATGVPGRVV